MITDWPIHHDDLLRPPTTVADAVQRLLTILDAHDCRAIAGMAQDDLIELHFSLGQTIRNAFALHEPDNTLLRESGTSHPDDASMLIIHALWQRLQAGQPRG